jgi:hypothetical protein
LFPISINLEQQFVSLTPFSCSAASLLILFGTLCLVFAVIGGILGIFDYELVISESRMGKMEAVTAFIVGGLGAVTFGGGKFWEKQIQKKQNHNS